MRVLNRVSLVAVSMALSTMAHSQALPTASQLFELSAFGGATGTYTGLMPPYAPTASQGRNLGITIGGDLALPYYGHYRPSVEVRGTYPVNKGSVDGQESILFGARFERQIRRFRPYAEFFYGRARIDYESGGYPSPNGQFIYLYTNTSVLSPGGGVDVDLTSHFAVKFDIQYQRLETPVAPSSHIYAKPLTAGVIYRFDFNHRLKYPDTRLNARPAPPPPRTAQQYLNRNNPPVATAPPPAAGTPPQPTADAPPPAPAPDAPPPAAAPSPAAPPQRE